MQKKYAIERHGQFIAVRNKTILGGVFDTGIIQNNDIIYELVPVGFVASGVFKKAPDATSLVLAEWHDIRVAPAPPEAHEEKAEEYEPLCKRGGL